MLGWRLRFQLLQQIAQATVREQVLGAYKPSISAKMARRDRGACSQSQLPTSFGGALGDSVEAFAQVAFDGSHIHLKILRQPMLVDNVALMQLRQDM